MKIRAFLWIIIATILGKDFDKKVISVGQDLKANDIDMYISIPKFLI